MNTIFLLSILPVAVLLFLIYRMDKYDREPIGKLILTFVMGCLVVLPASIQELVLDQFTPDVRGVRALYNAFVVAAFSEELWKLLFLYWVVWRSRHFDEYFDGIVYAVFISMGFACVENIGYAFTSEDMMSTVLLRAITAVPGHFLFAVSMGYYFSLAKFDPSNKWRHLGMALLIPMLLHGTYDGILMLAGELEEASAVSAALIGLALAIIFVVFDVMMWVWGMRRIRRMQQRSQEQGFDRQHPFDNFSWQVR